MSKKIGLSKTPPKSEARPLGTKRLAKPSKENSAAKQKKIDRPLTPVVDSILGGASQRTEDTHALEAFASPVFNAGTAIPPSSSSTKDRTMTLTLVKHSSNGKRAIYTGAAQSINFNVGLFPGKTAPTSIEIADGVFVAKAEKVAKVKLTAEERAALPKKTLAEKAAAAQKRADALKAKADAASAM